MENTNDAAIWVTDLLRFDAQMYPFNQSRFRPVEIIECARAHDLSRLLVGHAENDPSSALVGECHSVLYELLEVEVALSFFKFEVPVFVAA